MVWLWPSYPCLAQNYYDLVHHAQNYYDLEKINVEWSGPLTTVTPKLLRHQKNKCKVVWPSHHRIAQIITTSKK